MCGLVGLAGDCSLRNKDVFTDLLYIDTLRGHHSTGAAFVKRDKSETLLAKAPVPGHTFINLDIYKKALDTNAVKALIGHNRFATIGNKTAENAHPFNFDTVVGAHNGTIEHWALKNLKNWESFGTDSEAVFSSINEIGLKATVGKLYGAWALTYVNKTNNTMNMLRNDKRPLFYAYSLDLETLYWVSETDMLSWIVARNKIKFHENKIYECEADTHYEWYLPEYMGGKFKKPFATKVKGCEWVYAPNKKITNEDLYGWDDDGETQNYGFPVVGGTHQQSNLPLKSVKSSLAVLPKQGEILDKSRPKVNTKNFRPPYKDHNDHVVNKKNFFAMVNSGCVYCDDQEKVEPYKWGDFVHILKPDMDGRKIFLCEHCYNDDEVRDLVEASI